MFLLDLLLKLTFVTFVVQFCRWRTRFIQTAAPTAIHSLSASCLG